MRRWTPRGESDVLQEARAVVVLHQARQVLVCSLTSLSHASHEWPSTASRTRQNHCRDCQRMPASRPIKHDPYDRSRSSLYSEMRPS